jgi:hypothetical protein
VVQLVLRGLDRARPHRAAVPEPSRQVVGGGLAHPAGHHHAGAPTQAVVAEAEGVPQPIARRREQPRLALVAEGVQRVRAGEVLRVSEGDQPARHVVAVAQSVDLARAQRPCPRERADAVLSVFSGASWWKLVSWAAGRTRSAAI